MLEEKKIEDLLKLAEKCRAKNTPWHFHMLGKECIFNEQKGKYCIVFENESNEEIFCSCFEEKPLKEAEKLAKLVYGKKFMESEKQPVPNQEMKEMTQRAKQLNEKGIEWHHHHLPPKCKFNKLKGHHCAILEDPEKKETLEAIIDENPVLQLKEIEKIFYKKK